jgi:hypothetical protein
LAVVQKIVQDHGGEVSVDRTPQGKTVFRIVLPGRVKEAFRSTGKSDVDQASLVPVHQDGASQNSISRPSP